MAIDFPSNRNQLVPPQPAGPIQDGDVYVYQGITYTAKILGVPPDTSVQWNAATSAGNDAYVLKVGDTMSGQLTLPGSGTGKQAATVDQVTAVDTASVAKAGDTMTGQLTLPGGGTGKNAATVDQVDAVSTASVAKAGDTMTGNLTVPSLNGGPFATNQLINGDFRVYQRGTSNSAVGFGPADRWRNNGNRAIGINTGGLPNGFGGSIASSVAGNTLSIRQPVELPLNTAGQAMSGPFFVGSQWTLSFYVKDDGGAGGSIAPEIAWSDGSSSGGSSATAAIPTQTSTGSWARYVFPVTITSAPASSNKCLNVNLVLNGTGQVEVTGVQLEPGSVATPFEHRAIGTELALCQRYYYPEWASAYAYTTRVECGSATSAAFFMPYPGQVPMRTAPDLIGELRYYANRPGSSSTAVSNLRAVLVQQGVMLLFDPINTNSDVRIFRNIPAFDAEL